MNEDQDVKEEKRFEPPARMQRSLSLITIYHDGSGFRFAGVDAAGKKVRGTESKEIFPTAHMAKRAAHSLHPAARIR